MWMEQKFTRWFSLFYFIEKFNWKIFYVTFWRYIASCIKHWYFVSKIVLTYWEQNCSNYLDFFFEIQDWRPRIYKFLRSLEQIIQTVNFPLTDDFTIDNGTDFSLSFWQKIWQGMRFVHLHSPIIPYLLVPVVMRQLKTRWHGKNRFQEICQNGMNHFIRLSIIRISVVV